MAFIDFYNETDWVAPLSKAQAVLEHLSAKDVELIIVTNDEIQEINHEHRGLDKPTDVLSFPLEAGEHLPLGSIVVSKDFVMAGAVEFGHSEEEEFLLLFIHGLLHLLGYDHEVDSGEMRAKEEELILRFGLATSLIIRVEGHLSD